MVVVVVYFAYFATKFFLNTGRLLWHLGNLKAEYNILMMAYQKIFYFIVLLSFTYDMTYTGTMFQQYTTE